MFITNIVLENFRNFESLDLKFDRGFIVLAGPNGAGKTNFLESIYFGSSLRRFPETKYSQLYREGQGFMRVRLTAQNEESHIQEVFSEVRDGKHTRQYKVGNVERARNQYQSSLPVISFLPQDLNLLTRSPGNRRRYLNETLSLVSPQYRHAHVQYDHALRQRNELLKKISIAVVPETHAAELSVWDEKLAEYGSFVCTGREHFLEYVNANLQEVTGTMSPELGTVSFAYRMSGAKSKDVFLEKLRRAISEKFQWATTSVGPHRDDFTALISGKEAVGYLSRGEMRSLTLALKLIERKYVEERTGKGPIVLLDDVFSEFDPAHQQKLVDFLKTLKQIFLTTAQPDEVRAYFGEARFLSVEKGHVN